MAVAMSAFQDVLSGNTERDIAEIRAHVAFMQCLLADAQQDAIRGAFGRLLSAERNMT